MDAHCDTLTVLKKKGGSLFCTEGKTQLDLARLLRAGPRVQFFAAFVPPSLRKNAHAQTFALLNLFSQELAKYPRHLKLVTSASALEDLERGVKAVLSIEGGEALAGNLAHLFAFFAAGVRALTLTWNDKNELAGGINSPREGLTSLGKEVVLEMNKLGMLVDLAHLGERSFWEALEVSRAPVIVSHTNCRAECPHPRNLSDSQIKAVAAGGGAVALSFVSEFVDSEKPTLERLLDHFDHVAELVGTAYLGVGSDYDGTERVVKGLEDVSKIDALAQGLARRGYQKKEREAILGGNFLRIMDKVFPSRSC